MGLLFSTTHYHSTRVSGGGPSHVTVTENKAPTDESIRLLNEFEEKARKNIIAKVNVVDNTINAVSIMYTDNSCTASREGDIYLKFSVNGKEYNIHTKYDLYGADGNYKHSQELQSYLKSYTKTKVAKYILLHLEEEILRQLKEV